MRLPNKELHWFSATELVEAYRSGALSPVEVTRAVLDRIEAINPRINAFCLVDRDGAMDQARASENRWRRGETLGPLDGVPASVKDLILTRGWPTLRGSLTVDPDQAWNEDAPATARLRESGAVLLGKTTTPEFGWRGTTDSPRHGITRNPWDLTRTPGGSSGGATAAVASGLGPVGLGTDGGGSIRIPAAFTGTVGLKAHFGRIAAWPASPMGSVAHIGPQTRTVADAARMLKVLSQPDARDWTALPPGMLDPEAVLQRGVRGLRIAYSPRLGYVRHVDAQIESAVARAAHLLESLGAHVEEVDPPFSDPADIFLTHWFSSARHLVHRLDASRLAQLDPGLRAAIEHARCYGLTEVLDAQAARGLMAHRTSVFMQSWDVLLTPATAVLPFEAGCVMPEVPAVVGSVAPHDWTWWTPFSFPFNLTQQPAIVLPCGLSAEGLPMALQFVAPNHREDLCVQAAAAYESATPWSQQRPSVGPD